MKTMKKEHIETDDTEAKKRNPGCANFDYHYDSCLFRDECLVQKGQRCEYFERAVLPAISDNAEDESSEKEQ